MTNFEKLNVPTQTELSPEEIKKYAEAIPEIGPLYIINEQLRALLDNAEVLLVDNQWLNQKKAEYQDLRQSGGKLLSELEKIVKVYESRQNIYLTEIYASEIKRRKGILGRVAKSSEKNSKSIQKAAKNLNYDELGLVSQEQATQAQSLIKIAREYKLLNTLTPLKFCSVANAVISNFRNLTARAEKLLKTQEQEIETRLTDLRAKALIHNRQVQSYYRKEGAPILPQVVHKSIEQMSAGIHPLFSSMRRPDRTAQEYTDKQPPIRSDTSRTSGTYQVIIDYQSPVEITNVKTDQQVQVQPILPNKTNVEIIDETVQQADSSWDTITEDPYTEIIPSTTIDQQEIEQNPKTITNTDTESIEETLPGTSDATNQEESRERNDMSNAATFFTEAFKSFYLVDTANLPPESTLRAAQQNSMSRLLTRLLNKFSGSEIETTQSVWSDLINYYNKVGSFVGYENEKGKGRTFGKTSSNLLIEILNFIRKDSKLSQYINPTQDQTQS